MADDLGQTAPSAFGNNAVAGDGVTPCLKAGVQVSRAVANGLEDWVLTIPMDVIEIFDPGALAALAPLAFKGMVDDLNRFPSMTTGDKIRFVSSLGMRSAAKAVASGGSNPPNDNGRAQTGSTTQNANPSGAKPQGGGPSNASPSATAPSNGGPGVSGPSTSAPATSGSPRAGPSGGGGPPAAAVPGGGPSGSGPSGGAPSGGGPSGGGPSGGGPSGGGPSGGGPSGPQITRIGSGTVPTVTDDDLNIDQWRVGPLQELPAQHPTNPNIGLQKAGPPKINTDPSKITYHENMKFKDIRGAPIGKVESRWHSTDPNAPPGNSASGPTTVINTAPNNEATNPKSYLLPNGQWKTFANMTPEERNAMHRPFIDR